MSVTSPDPTPAKGGRPLTGRKVLLIAVAFFGVIIAVNVTMATLAVGGFPGLVSKNAYAEAQLFDAELKAERALGWRFASDYDAGLLVVRVAEKAGGPLDGLEVSAIVGRPATLQLDQELKLAPEPGLPGAYGVPVPLGAGMWRVEITALRGEDRYHITDEIYVSPEHAAPGAVGAAEGKTE
ncbi:FixH family protein [Albimonas sp. CAU 1670]|uniref:FixH family protein n=1 Tax=Albimonas sp. CAU 1670 TaxID=3032599 RepID=UPI0023DBC0DE|nr:FixH family protein [Albimonas sp. CAU 1670]MDF2231368.1 FixH family protein [Albimonas sp. CAU 1670]